MKPPARSLAQERERREEQNAGQAAKARLLVPIPRCPNAGSATHSTACFNILFVKLIF